MFLIAAYSRGIKSREKENEKKKERKKKSNLYNYIEELIKN